MGVYWQRLRHRHAEQSPRPDGSFVLRPVRSRLTVPDVVLTYDHLSCDSRVYLLPFYGRCNPRPTMRQVAQITFPFVFAHQGVRHLQDETPAFDA